MELKLLTDIRWKRKSLDYAHDTATCKAQAKLTCKQIVREFDKAFEKANEAGVRTPQSVQNAWAHTLSELRKLA